MINSGIGESQLNNLLATVNLPIISSRCLKNREREVGKAIEEVAEDSCNTAIAEEKELL